MEYDVKNDVWVTVTALPGSVNALCTEIGNDTVVLVNEALNADARQRAYSHEIRHKKRGDLHSDRPARDLEVANRQDAYIL